MHVVRFYFEQSAEDTLKKALELANSSIPNTNEKLKNFDELAKAIVRNAIANQYAELQRYKMNKMINNQKVNLNLSIPSGIDNLQEPERSDGIKVEFTIGDATKDYLADIFPFIVGTHKLRNQSFHLNDLAALTKAIVEAYISDALVQDMNAKLRAE